MSKWAVLTSVLEIVASSNFLLSCVKITLTKSKVLLNLFIYFFFNSKWLQKIQLDFQELKFDFLLGLRLTAIVRSKLQCWEWKQSIISSNRDRPGPITVNLPPFALVKTFKTQWHLYVEHISAE